MARIERSLLIVAVFSCALVSGCEPEGDRFEALDRVAEARRRASPEERAAARAERARVAGAPLTGQPPPGYPDGFPLIPGAEVLGGAVDPGVASTTTLQYALDREDVARQLGERATREGFRLIADHRSPSGTRRLRFEKGARRITASILGRGEESVLQVTAVVVEPTDEAELGERRGSTREASDASTDK